VNPITRGVLLLSLSAGWVGAQQSTYVPSQELPNGKEIVAVYIGAEDCGACHAPEVKDGVRRMKTLVQAQALKSGAAFSVIGVASDWDQKVAAAFLTDVLPFDQVVLGGNWTNLGIENFIWRDPKGHAGMPQVIILERTVTTDRAGMKFSEPRILRRLLGMKEIPEWVAKGAPIQP
jgi:hypothetical protein